MKNSNWIAFFPYLLLNPRNLFLPRSLAYRIEAEDSKNGDNALESGFYRE